MKKKYTGKYKEMADEFRKDGCDEYTVEKFIRQEMEQDEWAKGRGITDIRAVKAWKEVPEDFRELLLHNAFCSKCRGVTSFKSGYTLRWDHGMVVIEGNCKKCGEPIARVCN